MTYDRCRARCLFISNIVTFLAPKMGSSFLSARISRLFCGFWRLLALMYSHIRLTTSGRDKGLEPTTAASSAEGWRPFLNAAHAYASLPLLDLAGVNQTLGIEATSCVASALGESARSQDSSVLDLIRATWRLDEVRPACST